MNYTGEQLQKLIGAECYGLYGQLNDFILDHYNVEQIWDKGGKNWDSCLRYSRNVKTLCTFCFRQNRLEVLIILGKEERRKFEEEANEIQELDLASYWEYLGAFDNKSRLDRK